MSDPYLTPCFTQKIDEHSWLNEIEQLTHKLKILHGIDDVRIGMELEYELAPNYKVESRIPRKKKLEFIQALDAEIIAAEESGDAKETARLKRKKDQVEQFLPAELVMYDLIENAPETKGILEYAFGKKSTPEHPGYYDAPNCFEARLKHTDPIQLCSNHKLFMRTLAQKAEEYGLDISKGPSRHINFSFWKGGRNMLDAHDSEHMSTGKHIAEGINRASYDGLLMFLSPLQKIDFITAQAGRMNLLRLANGRLEARLPIHTPDYQHPEAIITTALAGALYGLNVHTKSDIANDPTDLVPARAIKRAVFRATDKKYEDTLHLLNTMKSLDGGKRYMVDRKDAEHNLANILQELGTVDIYHIQQIRNTQLRAPFSDESRKELRKLFSLIGGLNKTHIDEKSVAFFPPYEWLGKHIQLADVFDSFEIENIYAVGKTKNQQRIAAERVGRLSTSNALGTTLSPEFFETLKTKAKKEFGEPSADDMRHVQELNAMITGAATKLARRERTEQQDVYR